MPNSWDTNDGKREVVWTIFERLRANPSDVPYFVHSNNTKIMTAEMGDTTVPKKVHVYCLPQGDRALGIGRSLILEIPPLAVLPRTQEMLTYACTYTLWSTPILEQELADKGISLADFLAERGL